MKNKEIRAFNFEVRADQNEEHGHFLAGRPIVYDARTDLGWYDEIIERGALEGAGLRACGDLRRDHHKNIGRHFRENNPIDY